MGSSQEEVYRSKHQVDALDLLPMFDKDSFDDDGQYTAPLPHAQAPCRLPRDQGREDGPQHHGEGVGGHRGDQHSCVHQLGEVGGRGGVSVAGGGGSDVGENPRRVDPMSGSIDQQKEWVFTQLPAPAPPMSRMGIPAAIPLLSYGMGSSRPLPLPSPNPMKSSPAQHTPLPKRKFLLSPPPRNWKYTVDEVMADAAEAGPNAVGEILCGADKSADTVSSQTGVLSLNPTPYTLYPTPYTLHPKP